MDVLQVLCLIVSFSAVTLFVGMMIGGKVWED
jgi:hypothetical protein